MNQILNYNLDMSDYKEMRCSSFIQWEPIIIQFFNRFLGGSVGFSCKMLNPIARYSQVYQQIAIIRWSHSLRILETQFSLSLNSLCLSILQRPCASISALSCNCSPPVIMFFFKLLEFVIGRALVSWTHFQAFLSHEVLALDQPILSHHKYTNLHIFFNF